MPVVILNYYVMYYWVSRMCRCVGKQFYMLRLLDKMRKVGSCCSEMYTDLLLATGPFGTACVFPKSVSSLLLLLDMYALTGVWKSVTKVTFLTCWMWMREDAWNLNDGDFKQMVIFLFPTVSILLMVLTTPIKVAWARVLSPLLLLGLQVILFGLDA